MKNQTEDNKIYYFLGNITSHLLHALPLYERLGGTFVVLSDKAKHEVEAYGVPVINLDNKPFRWQRYGWRIKPIYHYQKITADLYRTTDFLNQNAKVVLFYELYDFDTSVRLTVPKTIFLTHGNMLKDYMAEGNRLEILKQYDYMAALGPYMKQKLLDSGVEPSKLVDIGIARTDAIIKNKGKVVISPTLQIIPGFDSRKKVVSYLPTFWGASSVYDIGLEIVRNMPEEYLLLFRPHPQTPQKLLKKYSQIIHTKSNVFYIPEGVYMGVGLIEILEASSVIIGDVSSVMLEAILTEKPLLFAFGNGSNRQTENNYDGISTVLDNSKTLDFTNVARLKDVLHSAANTDIIPSVWHDTIENVFFCANGGAAQAIAKFIKSI